MSVVCGVEKPGSTKSRAGWGGTSGPEYRRLRDRGHPYIFDKKERTSDLCGQRKLHINRFQFTIRKTALIMIK